MIHEEGWQVPNDRRARRIQEICEVIVRIMNLRPPQGEALRRIASALQRLPKPLHECGQEELRTYLTSGGRWHHAAHPTFTLSLATGVGKTRLAGAIIALLYLAKEARTFLVLAPRRAVLRRFEDALDPEFREYIFIESGWIPEPYVVTADQISAPSGVEAIPDMFRKGPTIYLLSPQLISTSERFRGAQPFTGRAPLEHLRDKRDLVVIADEAHHFGKLASTDAAKWTESIRSLHPALQLGLTATPRGEEGENLLYDYPLSKALVERFYTKDVHLLVRNFDRSALGEEDVDRATITYALNRLAIKEAATKESSILPFPNVKPVCVFFARDISHAEWVASILRESHGMSADEILVTHSRSSKKEEEVEKLLSIEDPRNPVRVVVNVQELAEGWDVRNVYIVTPLRAMATFQGALQAMGRGLRLPAGLRVGQPELDTLDVVCFGKQSLKTIVEEATTWLGRDASQNSGGFSADDFDVGTLTSFSLDIQPHTKVEIPIAELELRHEEVSIAVEPAAIAQSAQMAIEELDIARLKSRLSMGVSANVSREAFVSAATMNVLRVASQYLSDDLHYAPISEIVEKWLEATGVTGDRVEFDPVEVGSEIGQIIVQGARRRTLEYQPTQRELVLTFPGFQTTVVRALDTRGVPEPPPTISSLPLPTGKEFVPKTVIRGLDEHPWALSLHSAYSFDSLPEAKLAWLLDYSDEVRWWVRNEPRRFSIRTPAGFFSPDFLINLKSDEICIVEVKGATYWNPPESEARIKAASAVRWVNKQNEMSNVVWQFGVALDSDIENAGTLGSLMKRFRAS